MKYKTGMAKKYREEQEAANEQKRLREKHHVETENVVIVEKKLIASIGSVVRIIANMLILILAAIGLYSIINQSIRTEIFSYIHDVFTQIGQMAGR